MAKANRTEGISKIILFCFSRNAIYNTCAKCHCLSSLTDGVSGRGYQNDPPSGTKASENTLGF